MTVRRLRKALEDWPGHAQVYFREPGGLWTVDFIRPPMPSDLIPADEDVVLVTVAAMTEADVTGEVQE